MTGAARPRGPMLVAACVTALLALGACGADEPDDPTPAADSSSTPLPGGTVALPDGRQIYVRCTGSGSPTVVMEGGDLDTSDSYGFAEADVSAVTRTCVYDRANLGRSDPDAGPRHLTDLVADVEGWIEASGEHGPFVLVGTSGGGYISAGYAVQHPADVAGMVFVEVPAPFQDPPQEIVDETRWDHPGNTEQRDYLQVEKDAWAARTEIGDVPVTVISNRYSDAEIAASPYPSEQRGMRDNVRAQRGWLDLSPRAEQVVVTTGHAVEEADPQLVIDVILDVVTAARAGQSG